MLKKGQKLPKILNVTENLKVAENLLSNLWLSLVRRGCPL